MSFRKISLIALALALTLSPAVIAQAGQNATIAGTGTTISELRELGWTSDQIAQMQTPESQDPQRAQAPEGADTRGRGNWGLLGLLGLLGLAGLGGRRRAAHEERDIRRVA